MSGTRRSCLSDLEAATQEFIAVRVTFRPPPRDQHCVFQAPGIADTGIERIVGVMIDEDDVIADYQVRGRRRPNSLR